MFECTNHCEGVDLVFGNAEDDMLHELKVIAGDKEIHVFSKMIAESLIDFLNCWDITVPTTCCYQILMNSDLKKSEPEVIQFLCLSGLELCYLIFDYWSHCFMAASFYHCTSTACIRLAINLDWKVSGNRCFCMGKWWHSRKS